MKSPIKIILIILAVLQLLIVLYIVLPSIPKRIDSVSPGDSYQLDELSLAFDLASNNYKQTPLQEDIENGRKMIILKEPNTEKEIYITKITEKNYINMIDGKLETLQNPFRARFAINTTEKELEEMFVAVSAVKNRDFESMTMNVYKGADREFIFVQFRFSDGYIDYTAEGHIGKNYYSIDLVEESGPEDLLKFMETATVIQN